MVSGGVPGAAAGPAVEPLVGYYPSAVVATRGGQVRFLVDFGAGELALCEVAGAGRVAAALEAVGELAALARDRGLRVRVTIDDLRVVALVRQAVPVAAESPLDVVDVVTWQTARLFDQVYAMASRPEAKERLPTLVIGTDGSMSRREAAWAWVDGEGHHAWGRSQAEAIEACELEAIWQALRSVRGRDVVVLTDSRTAVLRIRRPTSGPAWAVEMARRTQAVGRRRSRNGFATQIAWVPGHAGIGLNEIAHRLALNGLRQVGLRTPGLVSREVAASIVADLAEPTTPPLNPRWTASFSPDCPSTRT